MDDINLLPQELKPKSYAIKLSKQLRKISSYSLIITLMVVILVVVANIALNFRYSSMIRSQNTLVSQVKALEDTEQRLILVQDRLVKISSILGSTNASGGVEVMDILVKNLPPEVTINSIEIVGNECNLEVGTNSSQNLSKLFSVVSNLKFSNVMLSSFIYDEDLGYRVGMKVTK